MATPRWIRVQIQESKKDEIYYIPILGTQLFILSEKAVPRAVLDTLRCLRNPKNYYETYDQFSQHLNFYDYIQLVNVLKAAQ
jgi:hypothetical protein